MAGNIPSPTPSEDNRKNERDDLTYSALHRVMSNSTQSYDEFVKGFSFLKESKNKTDKPEIVSSLQQRAKQHQLKTFNQTLPRPHPTETVSKSDLEPIKATRNVVNDIKRRRLGKIITGNKTVPSDSTQGEDIETELLAEGNTTSRLAGKTVIKTGSIKVDNFVEPDAGIEEINSEYTASFSAGTQKLKVYNADRTDASSDTVTVSPITARESEMAPANLDDNIPFGNSDTDKLLMNFLADLQNEMNTDKCGHDTRETSSRVDTNDIQAVINTKPAKGSSKLGTKGHSGKTDTINVRVQDTADRIPIMTEWFPKTENVAGVSVDDDDVNFDDDDCDAALNLCDDLNSDDLEIKIKPGELEQVVANEEKEGEKRTDTLNEIYKTAFMDSEGVVRTAAAERMVQEEVKRTANVEAERRELVFPGQIEETDDITVCENNTILEFKATYREAPVTSDNCVETTSDEIQPFQLDDSFDYDNVILTPKFSMEDLRQHRRDIHAQAVVL